MLLRPDKQTWFYHFTKYHKEKASDLKTYKCDHCAKVFFAKKSLMCHVRGKHKSLYLKNKSQNTIVKTEIKEEKKDMGLMRGTKVEKKEEKIDSYLAPLYRLLSSQRSLCQHTFLIWSNIIVTIID